MAGAPSTVRIGPEAEGVGQALVLLWRSRELLRELARREIRVRYKQTLLGVGWAVIQPVALMIACTGVFHGVLGVESGGDAPYPLFVYAGLLPWTFFSNGVTMATHSLVKNVELVTKVWFPRETLPLGSLAASLLDLLLASGLFVLLLPLFGWGLGWHVIGLVPVMLLLLPLTVGASLFVAALNVRYRDVKYIMPLALQVGLFASPVIYSGARVPENWQGLYSLNPLVAVIDGFRCALLGGPGLDAGHYVPALLVSLLVLGAGWSYFRRVEGHFADVI